MEASYVKINQNEEFCEACLIGKATKLPHKAKDQEQIDKERASGVRKIDIFRLNRTN